MGLGSLPLILDVELLECILDCLFGNLVRPCQEVLHHHHSLPWIILTAVETNHMDVGCWMLLGLISAHMPYKDPHMVMEYFNTSINTPEGVGLYTLLHLLKVLFTSGSGSRLSEAVRSSLQGNLLTLVQRFKSLPLGCE